MNMLIQFTNTCRIIHSLIWLIRFLSSDSMLQSLTDHWTERLSGKNSLNAILFITQGCYVTSVDLGCVDYVDTFASFLKAPLYLHGKERSNHFYVLFFDTLCLCLQNTSQIFPPTTGGAQRMCEELNLPLLGRVPLDPRIGTRSLIFYLGRDCFKPD